MHLVTFETSAKGRSACEAYYDSKQIKPNLPMAVVVHPCENGFRHQYAQTSRALAYNGKGVFAKSSIQAKFPIPTPIPRPIANKTTSSPKEIHEDSPFCSL
jgi:hypothetical protein